MIADSAYPKEDSARVNVSVDSEIGRALSILNWRGTVFDAYAEDDNRGVDRVG